MWKVGDVEPVRVMGAEGYPYGFNVSTEDGKPVVSFAYASRALAEAAATHLESALSTQFRFSPTQRDGDRKGPLAMDSKAIRSQRWAEVVASLPT